MGSSGIKAFSEKYYNKATVLMIDVIIPEIKLEGESFINQTLRASVVMTEEAIKAYTPHAIVIKDSVTKAAMLLKDRSVVAMEKVNVAFKKYMDQLLKFIKELLNKAKEHKMYKEIINHDLVIKTQEKIEDLLKTMKEKLEELKMHPKTLEYQQKIKEQINKIKAQLQVYRNKLEKYYSHPKVVKALNTLKKLEKSLLFTTSKVSEKLEPLVDDAIEFTKLS